MSRKKKAGPGMSKNSKAQSKRGLWKKWHYIPLTLAVALSSYIGLDQYSDFKIKARANQYRSMRETCEDKDMSSALNHIEGLNFFEKLRYTIKLDSMDSAVEQDNQEFLDYIKANEEGFVRLTESDSENGGRILRRNSGFEIERNTYIKDDIIRYATEIMSGDFRNKDKLLEYFDIVPQFFILNKEVVSKMIEIMEAYSKVANAPENKVLGVFLFSNTGEMKDFSKESEKIYHGGMQYFQDLTEGLKMMSLSVIDDEFLGNEEIFSRFHTHPLNDPNYMPSCADEANSYIIGPNYLFSQTNGIFHVYRINRGKSEEMYTKNYRFLRNEQK